MWFVTGALTPGLGILIDNFGHRSTMVISLLKKNKGNPLRIFMHFFSFTCSYLLAIYSIDITRIFIRISICNYLDRNCLRNQRRKSWQSLWSRSRDIQFIHAWSPINCWIFKSVYTDLIIIISKTGSYTAS